MRRAGARLFELIRTEDPTGVSGTGVIAEGVEWEDGSASLRWNGKLKSVAHYDRLADIIAIHGHGGSTKVRFTNVTVNSHQAGFSSDLGWEDWSFDSCC